MKKKKSYPLYRCKNRQKRFQVTQSDAIRTAFGETLSIAPCGCPVDWDLDFGKICLGRSKACRGRAGRRGKFPLGGGRSGERGDSGPGPRQPLSHARKAWWRLLDRGPLRVAGPSPQRSPWPGNSILEWQSAWVGGKTGWKKRKVGGREVRGKEES